MVNKSTLRSVAVIVGIFLGGAGTGAAITFAWSHNKLVEMMERRGPFRHEMRVRALQRVLHLSPQQRREVAAILEREEPERRRAIGQMMNACGESIRGHKARVDAEIRAVLRPEQQKAFDELAERQNERLLLEPMGPHMPPGEESSNASHIGPERP